MNDRMNEDGTPQVDTSSFHEPVLADQVLELLNPRPGMTFLDCTVGLGGHAKLIVPHLAPGGRYIGLDVDPRNLAVAKESLADAPVEVDLIRSNFAGAKRVLDRMDVSGVDLLLADLGVASNQISRSESGLSFAVDGPLDMRLDPTLPETAGDLVNTLSERELADVIYQYGEERLSRKIARKIVEQRDQKPILRTKELATLVRRVYGATHRKKNRASRREKIDPATRTFMALRIAVNNELIVLQSLLSDLPCLLRFGAVAAMISFHSLEDRPVKRAFVGFKQEEQAEVLTKKPLTAEHEERHSNPRSRSAKLRAIRWLNDLA